MLITKAVQQACLRQGRNPFVQVHHAMEASNVNMEQLPSSPPLVDGALYNLSGPSSPGYFSTAPGTRDGAASPGYFARTVFNTAVSIQAAIAPPHAVSAPADLSHYDEWARLQAMAPLPSPNPAVLPLSQQISVLERYIPPTSPHDDQRIFSNASSTMVDRLFELSPHGGCLLFVYPTKAGAEAFAQAYLGPILEPLLRRLMAVHGMAESFCDSLDKMRAIEFMQDFAGLKRKIENICSRAKPDLGHACPKAKASDDDNDDDNDVTPRAHDAAGSSLRLVYARPDRVRLNPDDWKEWWASQEAGRIKKTISLFYEMGYPMPGNMGPSDLERAIIDGVRPVWAPQMREGQGFKRRSRTIDGQSPAIEVGVFVIRRTG